MQEAKHVKHKIAEQSDQCVFNQAGVRFGNKMNFKN